MGEITRIGPDSRDLERLYAEAKAKGLPLTRTDLTKNAPRTPNHYPEFESRMKRLKPIDGSSSAWLSGTGPKAAKVRTEFAGQRKAVEDLVKWVERHEHFRNPHDFRKGDWTLHPEILLTRQAGQLMMMLAAAQAKEGKSSEAAATIRAAGKMTREMTDHPIFIFGTMQAANLIFILRGTLVAMDLDPDHAVAYLAAGTEGWDLNPAYHLQGEVYTFAWYSRNFSTQEMLGMAYPALGPDWEAIYKNRKFKDEGLPTNPANRAMLTSALRTWLRVFNEADETGRFSDWKKAGQVLEAEFDRLAASERPSEMLVYAVNFSLWMDPLDTFEAAQSKKVLMIALGRILRFKDQVGRWPVSLKEAGVEPIPDPNAPGKFAQYRADAAGVSLWTVGEDGDDDGGIIESTAGGALDGDLAVGLPLKRIGLPIERRRSGAAGGPGLPPGFYPRSR